MALLRRLVHPRSWPVRWRLAAGSAGLTLAILLVFAAVIGHLATQRIRNDFNREMHEAAASLASQYDIKPYAGGWIPEGPELDDFALPNGASVRIFARDGSLLKWTHPFPHLGLPKP